VILLIIKAGSLQYQHGEGDTPGEGEEAREEPTSKIREEAAIVGLARPNSKNNPLEKCAVRPIWGPPFSRCARSRGLYTFCKVYLILEAHYASIELK
jgi:hypothetical protein